MRFEPARAMRHNSSQPRSFQSANPLPRRVQQNQSVRPPRLSMSSGNSQALPLEELGSDTHEMPLSPPAMLGPHLRIQAARGFRAGVIELRPGLYLVAEVPSGSLRPEFGSAALLAPLALNLAAQALANPEQTQAIVNSFSQGVQNIASHVANLPHAHASAYPHASSHPQPSAYPHTQGSAYPHAQASTPTWQSSASLGYMPYPIQATPSLLLPLAAPMPTVYSAAPNYYGSSHAIPWLQDRRWP